MRSGGFNTLQQVSSSSLYRRHRPRTFADVVGQEHVVQTLSNAVEQERIHHAYLFVGSRGTGKTSMAKILSACLNCANGDGKPTVTPCGVCESCVSIADATSIDVVEMDAASNNSVDDIRALRDQVSYAPVGGKYKVYILDEAHMLSGQAWNAFLKTLEEPPPRTVFVLATTEAAKVLPTVADRCHRFDFRRPTAVQLSSVLKRVALKESIEIDDEAVALVARAASGSFRDALGTLEQMVAYAGNTVLASDVLNVLGVSDFDALHAMVEAVTKGDGVGCLRCVEAAAESGRDLTLVLKDVEGYARTLLVAKMIGKLPDELRLSHERDSSTVDQAKRIPGATIIRLIDLVAAALASIKDGADERTQLELVLIRAAVPALDPSQQALAARLERLEQAGPAGPSQLVESGTAMSDRQPVAKGDDLNVASPSTSFPMHQRLAVEQNTTSAAVESPSPSPSPSPQPAAEAAASAPSLAEEPVSTAAVEQPVQHAELAALTPEVAARALKQVAGSISPSIASGLGMAQVSAVNGRKITLAVPEGKGAVVALLTTPTSIGQIQQQFAMLLGGDVYIDVITSNKVQVVAEAGFTEEEVLQRLIEDFGARELQANVDDEL